MNASSNGTAHTRTLERAVEIAGSAERLAEVLGVSLPDLLQCMAGVRPLPPDVYLRALDIVARGASGKPRGG